MDSFKWFVLSIALLAFSMALFNRISIYGIEERILKNEAECRQEKKFRNNNVKAFLADISYINNQLRLVRRDTDKTEEEIKSSVSILETQVNILSGEAYIQQNDRERAEEDIRSSITSLQSEIYSLQSAVTAQEHYPY